LTSVQLVKLIDSNVLIIDQHLAATTAVNLYHRQLHQYSRRTIVHARVYFISTAGESIP